MAEYDRKTKTWRASIMIGGRRYRKRGFTSRQSAQYWEAQKRIDNEREILGVRNGDEEISLSYKSYMDHKKGVIRPNTFIRYQFYARNIQNFLRSRKIKYISELRDKYLIEYQEHRKAKNYSPQTINFDTNLLYQVIEYAVERGVINYNPIKKPKRIPPGPKSSKKMLSVEQFYQIIEIAKTIENPFLAPAIAVLGRTGLRIGELVSLRHSDVDLTNNTMFIRAEIAKGKKSRLVPFGNLAKQALQELMSQANKFGLDCFLVSRYGKPQNSNLCANAMAFLRKYLPPQLKDITLHTFRSFFISQSLMHGDDIIKVMAIVGHEDYSTTRQYLFLLPNYVTDIKEHY